MNTYKDESGDFSIKSDLENKIFYFYGEMRVDKSASKNNEHVKDFLNEESQTILQGVNKDKMIFDIKELDHANSMAITIFGKILFLFKEFTAIEIIASESIEWHNRTLTTFANFLPSIKVIYE